MVDCLGHESFETRFLRAWFSFPCGERVNGYVVNYGVRRTRIIRPIGEQIAVQGNRRTITEVCFIDNVTNSDNGTP